MARVETREQCTFLMRRLREIIEDVNEMTEAWKKIRKPSLRDAPLVEALPLLNQAYGKCEIWDKNMDEYVIKQEEKNG